MTVITLTKITKSKNYNNQQRNDNDVDESSSISNNNNTNNHQQQHNNNNNNVDNAIKRGDNLVTIDWEGHTITDADELYHTIWETFTDQTTIKSPINGKIMMMMTCRRPNEEEEDDEATTDTTTTTTTTTIHDSNNADAADARSTILHEDTVLTTIITSLEELNMAYQNQILVNEEKYLKLLLGNVQHGQEALLPKNQMRNTAKMVRHSYD